ncbi:hypothetical protein MTP03_34010 [Tsukamurella sp. PLM1]|nr:hypothetical protein MTP03_34010 [Tsukamurella sp. PLM1]
MIQPSALRAIHAKFFSVPPAPIRTGTSPVGFGQAQLGLEGDELAVVGGLLVVPQGPHRLQVLAQHRAAASRRHAVIGEFVQVPAESGAQGDAAAGQVVDGGDRLGQGYRVRLHRQRDRGGQFDPLRHRGRGGQGGPRIQGAQVPLVGQLGGARTGMRGIAPGGDVAVLGDEVGRESRVLDERREPVRRHPAIRGELDDADPD